MKADKTAVKETPLMKQYNEIKRKYPDACLLFRVGDFYETFGEDAVKASKILGIILTKRGAGSPSEIELAGFPHHSLATYMPKLVKAGLRVAICDQLEDPKLVKGIVKRGVTELITPGVALNDEVLFAQKNNFLCAIHLGKKQHGIAFLDVSTGEFFADQGSWEYLDKLLQNFQPSEVLWPKKVKSQFAERWGTTYNAFYLEDWIYTSDYATEVLNKHFNTASLKGFGMDELTEGIVAAGAIFYYLSETQHDRIAHITQIQRIPQDDYMWMDRFTIRNLELFATTQGNGVSLLNVIDHTVTPMGARLLHRWLALPLKDKARIEQRLDGVQFMAEDPIRLGQIRSQLQQISDMERLVSKLATAKIGPKEINVLKESIIALAPIKSEIEKSEVPTVAALGASIDLCQEVIQTISSQLNSEAPVAINKGGAIATGVNEELDELRAISTSGKDYLAKIEREESERTGITSLKVAFNNVFGYYIEVRNTHKDKVPEHWVRKQTLVNAERYITEELKTYESKILGAEERIAALEAQLYEQLLNYLLPFIPQLQKNAQLTAQIDVLAGFAQLAKLSNYVRPQLTDDFALDIKDGRHPVIEKQLPVGVPYIANDVYLDREAQQLIMITGPNMSGKSAILRQTALIVLLAQMGSFVPASAVNMGVVDKIFTRVGASDNISMGESTFMVEMNETASILNNLSERSLVLLDEIGRGTSTYDGISIAWAIAEFLHEHPARAKTLFATHYHELNGMADKFPRIKNYNVAVKELKDNVLFVRKLTAGGSAHSFGIHVAKMAGMPQMVIKKAQKILIKLEKDHSSSTLDASLKAQEPEMQLSFFQVDDPVMEEIKKDILELELDHLTPMEALMQLNELKSKLSKK